MNGLDGLLHGFAVALTPGNLAFALIGCLIGMLVGVLPGIGQSTGMALLIPLTYFLPPAGAIIMLASIFYGAAYGGTITSVLLNVPGESESVVTTFDGHPMARAGRAGVALTISAIGSFVGGLVATLGLAFAALPLSQLGLRLGPPEYFALMLLGLTLAVSLLGKSLVKGVLALGLGLFLAQIGSDPTQGSPRFTFGQTVLLDGVPLLAVLMGFFGVSDVLLTAARRQRDARPAAVERLVPGRADLAASAGPIGRGSVIGFVLGLIPGMVAAVSTFASYVVERRVSKRPERFGKGAIQGVAGPETANNAFANASFIPLFTLGIPGSAALAILLGAFLAQGITPGPEMFRDHPEVAWGVIASMIVGNAILLVLSVPLVRGWVQILRLRPEVLGAIVLTVSVVGIYSVRNSVYDIGLLLVFAVLGCVLKLLSYPLPPLILAFVLGERMEAAFRQSLVLNQGDATVFVTRPIAAVLLALALIAVVVLRVPSIRGRKS